MKPSAEVQDFLASIRSRGELRRASQQLDDPENAELREAICHIVQAQTHLDMAEITSWPVKRLLRRALDRESAAVQRKNPLMRDESFRCLWCGLEVAPAGKTARDHCTRCLRSIHVDDVFPGDRVSACGGILQPVTLSLNASVMRIHYCCDRCSKTCRVRVLTDVASPDDPASLRLLSTGADPWPHRVRP